MEAIHHIIHHRPSSAILSRVVCSGRDPAASSGPIRVEELSTWLIDSLEGVRAEEISLSLQQVRRQAGRAVSVVEGKRRGESGRRHTILNPVDDAPPPGGLVIVQRLAEEFVEQEIRQLRILVVRFLDLPQEAAADDTAATPHQGYAAEVQVPLLLFRRLA